MSSSAQLRAHSKPRLSRHGGTRHVQARASLTDLAQQLQATGQQAAGQLSTRLAASSSVYTTRPLSSSAVSVSSSVSPMDSFGESLRAVASEPHWGSQLLASAVERWTAALSDLVAGAAQGGGQPIEQAQQALATLRQALPQLAAPPAGSGLGELSSKLQTSLDSLAQSAAALEQALSTAAADKGAAVSAAAAQLGLPQGLALPTGTIPAQLPAALASSPGLTALAAVAGAAALIAATRGSPPPPPTSGGGSGGSAGSAGQQADRDYLPSAYDAELVAAYFEARPVQVAQRAAQVALEAARLGTNLLLDMAQGKLEAHSWARAAQLRSIIEKLGPAYVKVAQALSTRVDILSPPYLSEIELLQDRVKPFDDSAAMEIVSNAYGGRPINEIFSSISPKAVAAASLGQVYRGVLRPEFGGREVAVKVRRPGVLESVALDLYLMRQLALYLRTLPQVKSDWAAIIDKWAEAFFEEMDYQIEADNARRFKRDVEEKNLTGIVVPEVLLATHEVLLTQWIEGEKLAESNAADVRELCNTLLSAYLVQLLETGFLHADPHPGNLLRTPEGRIAILDYGLMSTIPPNYSLALVEYIAHLSVGDYEGVAEDLVKLGFLKEGADKTGLVEPLGILLKEITAGGGAANVNIDLVMAEVDKLADRYPFQVPPYFALILRCFSVIEGIALRVDPSYAIVSECFPYLSRRLLSDNDPRARQALRDLLFGDKEHIDLERLQRLADGFGNYTVAGLTDVPHRRLPQQAQQQQQQQGRGPLDVAGDSRPLLSPAAKEALRVLFSPQGNYAQELLVGEAAATVDAASRQAAALALGGLLRSAPALAGLGAIEALGPLRTVLLPLPTPLELLNRVAPTLQPSEEDLQALATAQGVANLLQRSREGSASLLPGQPTPQDMVRLAQELGPMLPELLPGVARTGEMFGRELVRRAALRLASDMQMGGGSSGPQAGAQQQ